MTIREQGAKEYRKTGHILAVQMTEPFTAHGNGGPTTGEAGDWKAENPNDANDQWAIRADVFAQNYVAK